MARSQEKSVATPWTRPALAGPFRDETGCPPAGKPAGRSWFKRLATALMLPREHGAWAMLLMPYLVGTAAAGWGGWRSLLLLGSVLLLFSSSRPLELALQSIPDPEEARARRRQAIPRLAAYLTLGGAAGATLLLLHGRWALLGIGGGAGLALAAQLVLRRRHLDRAWPARLLSIAALSATGPAAYYAASGALDRHAAAVWLLGFLYSGASVFYVRLFYRTQKPAPGVDARAQAERHLVTYLVAAAVAVATLAALGWFPPLGALTLLPLVAKSAWARSRRDYRPALKQIGLAEIGHTTLFALLASVAVATWR